MYDGLQYDFSRSAHQVAIIPASRWSSRTEFNRDWSESARGSSAYTCLVTAPDCAARGESRRGRVPQPRAHRTRLGERAPTGRPARRGNTPRSGTSLIPGPELDTSQRSWRRLDSLRIHPPSSRRRRRRCSSPPASGRPGRRAANRRRRRTSPSRGRQSGPVLSSSRRRDTGESRRCC